MMERCRIFAVCEAGSDGVAIHSKCGMLFSLLHAGARNNIFTYILTDFASTVV